MYRQLVLQTTSSAKASHSRLLADILTVLQPTPATRKRCVCHNLCVVLFRQEVQAREQQLVAANSAVLVKEAEGKAAAAAAGAAAAEALSALAADKAQLEVQTTAIAQQVQQQKQQHESEMHHVECRVKAAIAKKDEAIMRLQQQLTAALDQLRGTEAVLEAQQAALCD
jgi:hypothetical protein